MAVSGGVDSAVAVHLLKEAGWRVHSLHLRMLEGDAGDQAAAHARKVSAILEVPFHLLDVRARFRERVVSYFTEAYLSGLTPNPCAVCNPSVKFHELLRFANELGLGHVATGHYAIIERGCGGWLLKKGLDSRKDQSYFLFGLEAHWLERIVFPLGRLTKSGVRKLGEQIGIGSLVQDESQEVCFLSGPYWEFLRTQRNDLPGRGEIVTSDGRVIGIHDGFYRYTVGQRRGIGIPNSTPYYVLGVDAGSNRVIVGKAGELCSSTLRVPAPKWLVQTDIGSGLRCTVKIRYRHPGAEALLLPGEEKGVVVQFDTPQRAVTPGQFAVFYKGETVLGGGEIEKG